MNSKIPMLAGSASVPAIVGIGVGAGMIILFSVFFVPVISPDVHRTWISYEPTQCSTPPWISYWNELHPDDDFRLLNKGGQYQIIKEYFRERVGISLFDVTYRTTLSPSCMACGCSAGYIIDLNVNDNDAGKLRENILKATVQVGNDTKPTVQRPSHVTVIIPEGSSLPDSEHNNFEPETIKVVIGVNNTVRWMNQDSVSSSIRADDKIDPEFYDATHLDENSEARLLLNPSETFEFTFTRPGEFGYHSEPHPHKRGIVVVLQEPEN
jgi:plastocyanin